MLSVGLSLWDAALMGGGGAVAPVSIKQRLAAGRVDFVGFGDSNQLKDGVGWDEGWQYALTLAGYPMYATGLLSAHENNGAGASTGYTYSFNASQPDAAFATSGAPAALDAYLHAATGYVSPHNYAYLASGTFGGGENQGFILSANGVMDVTHALQFDFCYGTFASGSGAFRPTVRRNATPWTEIKVNSIIQTNTGVEGIAVATMALSADASRAGWPLNWKFGSLATSTTGPFFGLWWRASDPGVTAGYSFSTLYGLGGSTARDFAYSMQGMSDTALTYYFQSIRAFQGSTKTVAIVVNTGVNDRNLVAASVGPLAIADGDSAEAYADNIHALVTRIETIWSLNGWDRDELCFVLMVSHPVATPTDDAELIAYRAALQVYAAGVRNAQVLDLNELCPCATILANGWYLDGGADRNHLTAAGYYGISQLMVAALS